MAKQKEIPGPGQYDAENSAEKTQQAPDKAFLSNVERFADSEERAPPPGTYFKQNDKEGGSKR